MDTGKSAESTDTRQQVVENSTSVSQTAKTRMDWPDVAKGLSVLGVVVLHVTLSIPGGSHTALATINHFLDPLRMPLFFLVSGFFSVKVLNQSFSELFKGRLWFFLIPYLIWAPIEMLASRFEGKLYADRPLPEFSYYLLKLANSTNMYWFLYFLILFNLVLWATRKLPGWLITLLLAAPWLLMPAYSESEILRKTIIYLPLFFIGAYFRPLISRFAETAARPRAIVFAVSLYVFGVGLTSFTHFLADREPGRKQLWLISLKDDIATMLGGELSAFDLNHISALLVRVLSIPVGIVLAVWLAKIPPVSAVLKFCGRYTLAIYIGHALGLTVFFGYFFRWNFMTIDSQSANPLQWTGTWIVIAFVFALLGALIVHVISTIPVLGWSLIPPHFSQRTAIPESSSISSPSVQIGENRR